MFPIWFECCRVHLDITEVRSLATLLVLLDQWGLGKHWYQRACSDFSVGCASGALDNVGSVIQGLGIDWGIPRDKSHKYGLSFCACLHHVCYS